MHNINIPMCVIKIIKCNFFSKNYQSNAYFTKSNINYLNNYLYKNKHDAW